MTGGSRVLVNGALDIRFATKVAIVAVVIAMFSALIIVPSEARGLAIVMLLLAVAYTTPPIALNFRALGELDAAIITSILVPHFMAVAQGAAAPLPPFMPSLALLVIPPFLSKVALFLLLNMADRRPDWAGGKTTLAVVLGDRRAAILHAALLTATYATAFLIVAWRILTTSTSKWYQVLAFIFLAPSGYLATHLALAPLREMPYRLDRFLGPALFHSTLLVWSILAHSLVVSFTFNNLARPYTPLIVIFAALSARNYLRPFTRFKVRKHDNSEADADVESQQLSVPSSTNSNETTSSVLHKTPTDTPDFAPIGFNSDRLADVNRADTVPPVHDIIVVGAGVAGLVSALTLDALGFQVLVLERRSQYEAGTGADVALWPGAIRVLRKLGVRASFFEHDCFPLRTVHLCNMIFSDGERPVAEVLNTVNMETVTEGTGEQFVLVSRRALMDALCAAVPAGLVVYDASVTKVDDSSGVGDGEPVTVTYAAEGVAYVTTSRVVVGADGARSLVRCSFTHSGYDDNNGVRFCNEVCYRGIVHAEDGSLPRPVDLALPDSADQGTMRINYGAGLRSSFGHMSGDGQTVYWWVKQVVSEMPAHNGKLDVCPWPSPLRELHDITPRDAFYMHPIEDSAELPRWSGRRCVLVGDAAHLVTPNMGQGACLATEDAFVLAILLRKFWKWPDGHIEAFYTYENTRKPYARAVAAEARKQLFLGQLSSPLTVWLRESLLRLLPSSVLQKTLRRHNFPVQEYIDEFDTLRSQI